MTDNETGPKSGPRALPLSPRELHWLWYFAVAAEERSLRRAARRLCLSEPPLSRQLRQLEERLGFRLFARHSRGLSLTAEGEAALAVVRPLLKLQTRTLQRLGRMAKPLGQRCALGLTTAFEQGLFAPLETALNEAAAGAGRARIRRAASPALARDVLRGRLDAALVALPLCLPPAPAWPDAPEAGPEPRLIPLAHAEPLVAALPAAWLEPRAEDDRHALRPPLSLPDLNGRPLFWFCREANPAWFDRALAVFRQQGFRPRLVPEPPEHDVLLARVAAGEGLALLPASFTAIWRPGVRFEQLAESSLLSLRLGLLMTRAVADTPEGAALAALIVRRYGRENGMAARAVCRPH